MGAVLRERAGAEGTRRAADGCHEGCAPGQSAPEVYIVEESVQNAFAVKLGKKNLILLTDDMVWGALQSRDPRALGFIVGHELAHIALNHTGTLRSSMRTTFRPLARADELSADNVAAQLVGDARIAIHGLALLTVGPQLLPYIVVQRPVHGSGRFGCTPGAGRLHRARNPTHAGAAPHGLRQPRPRGCELPGTPRFGRPATVQDDDALRVRVHFEGSGP
ncbi:M48 family metalloprotease [Archangium violaceum]|uniref:M48 family metalloprotease n=1 Tax=Archangium violaceum TaxID=83451 RepID=UPI0036DCCA79